MARKKSNSVSKVFSRGKKAKVSAILSRAPQGQQSNLPGSSAPQMSVKPSTGLVGSKGQYINSPTFGTQGVNVNQSLASGGLKIVSGNTGLVGVGGKPVQPPRISNRGNSSSSVNIGQSIDSGGLVLGTQTAVLPVARTGLSSNASFGGSSGGSSLASNTPNIPSSNVINTPTLGASSTQLTFPEQTIADYSQLIPTPQEQVVQEATEEKDSALKDLLESMAEPPSSADAYKKAQKETQILQRQQEVNDLTGQLNGIVAKGEAQQLQLIGQGRGIPEAIIGGQQAQIARETAIAALPVQAQLSAAQGNLEMANDNLETLFKIYSDDAKNEYEYKKEVKRMVYEYASEKEKRALEVLDKQEERDYQEKQAILKDGKDYAKMAFANGQSSLGAKIMKLNINSPTYSQELSELTSQLSDPILELDIRLKNAQIAKAWADARAVDTSSGQLTEAQLTKIDNSPQGKKLVSLSGLYQKSQTYKNLVDTYGFEAKGEAKSLMDRAYADLKIAYKEAANLGALTGPDVALLEEAIKPSSGSAIAYFNYKLAGGQGGISSTIDTGLDKTRAEALMNYEQLTSRNPSYAGSEYVRSLISPFAIDFSLAGNASPGDIVQTEDGILLKVTEDNRLIPL